MVLALLLARAPAAQAHREPFLKSDRIELHHDRVVLTLSYIIPAGDQARALRRLFDRDRSGGLDEAEQAALGQFLKGQALHFLRIEVDGQLLALHDETIDVQAAAGQDHRIAMAARASAAAPLGTGAHRILLSDRHKDRHETVLVQVVGGDVRVTSSLPPQPFVYQDHPLELQVEPAR